MSSRNLEHLLAPRSVVLIGASDHPRSIGATVLRNLLEGGFDGPLWTVGERVSALTGPPAYSNIAELPETPDLAVICAPPETVPHLISKLGQQGTRAAVVINPEIAASTAGVLTTAMREAAKPYTMRILGPNGLGMLLPRIGLNASSAQTEALRGNFAFIAQSGALTTAMLDCAHTRKIGFSCFISLGDGADVDFADLLNYLSHDPHTRAIVLCVESIGSARKFMSAARGAARNKPVIVMKAGAVPPANDVYDAAFRRAGMLRVGTTRELFDAAESLQAASFRHDPEQLMEVSAPIPASSFVSRLGEVRDVIGAALAQGRNTLTEPEVRSVLGSYDIPIVSAVDRDRVRRAAAENGSPQLFARIALDPTFGPVVRFGRAVSDADIVDNQAVELLPLNRTLAAELISRPRFWLAGHRESINMQALEQALIHLAQLAVDVAEIVEIEINPLLADEQGAAALDACIRVARATVRAADRLAIRPYPKELEELVEFDNRKILLRPIRPEDLPQHREFLTHVTPEDMQTRFLGAVPELADSELAYLTQIDYDRAMAFVAEATTVTGGRETLGVARAHADPDNHTAEFAVLVRSDQKGRGLGSILMEKLVRYCRARGVHWITGEVLADNQRMLQLSAAHGFKTEVSREGAVRVSLEVQPVGRSGN